MSFSSKNCVENGMRNRIPINYTPQAYPHAALSSVFSRMIYNVVLIH